MTAVGFEPTHLAIPELESGALDRSAKLSSDNLVYMLGEDAASNVRVYLNAPRKRCPIPDSNRGYHGHNVAS